MAQYLDYVAVFKKVDNDVFNGWIGHVPSIDITETVMGETLADCENKLRAIIKKYGSVGKEKATTLEYRSIYPNDIITRTYVEV